jgi:integrase
MNEELLAVVEEYGSWYSERFGRRLESWYVFPAGRPRPNDPTSPQTSLKTAWRNLRKAAAVQGRFHDNRHTFVTDLAESGVGDEVIRDMAGHVSKQMLKHYSHIRMEAKRKAVQAVMQRNVRATDQATGRSLRTGVQDSVQGSEK